MVEVHNDAGNNQRPPAQTRRELARRRLANALKTARERAGLSQSQFARLLDYASHSTPLEWERGSLLPSADMVMRIEDELELERGELGKLHADAVAPGDEDDADPPRRSPLWPDFADVLREHLRHAGISPDVLAKLAHCHRATVYRDLKGGKPPPVDRVVAYEQALRVESGTLVAARERTRAARDESPPDGTIEGIDEAEGSIGTPLCPYKGLRSFERVDAAWFCGRTGQITTAVGRLVESRFLAVVGTSGSGKSSFLHAGVLARLDEIRADGEAPWLVAQLTPGQRPLHALASAVSRATGGAVSLRAETLRKRPDRLARALGEAGAAPLVIVVDQLEELFTHADVNDPRDTEDARCFVDALIGAWRAPASRVHLLFAVRSDFYEDPMSAYPALRSALTEHHWLLGPMSRDELRQAIEGPAIAVGIHIEPGLPELILNELGDDAAAALPLLSHALRETFWQRRLGRLHLTTTAYSEIGGVQGAIERTADQALERLSGDEAVVRRIFVSLTALRENVEPGRRRVDRRELAEDVGSVEALDRVLDVLTEARLVTIEATTVSVAHEALVRHWPKLRAWLKADAEGELVRRDLQAAARRWEELDGAAGTLLSRVPLTRALEQVTRLGVVLGPREREFLAVSVETERREDAEIERRNVELEAALAVAHTRLRRLWGSAAGLATLLAIVLVVAGLAVEQRAKARRDATRATSLALVSSSSRLVDSRPDVSLLLALEAYRVLDGVEARSSVLGALTAVRRRRVVARELASLDAHSSSSVALSGRVVASASADGAIRFRNARTGAQMGASLATHASSIAFSPDGRILASAGYERVVRLWDVASHRPLGRLAGHRGDVNDIAFAPSGDVLASTGDDGTLRLWDTQTRRQIGRSLMGHRGDVNVVAFSRDGRTVASGGDDRTVRLWSVRTHRAIGRLAGHEDFVSSVAFRRDGKVLASGSWDGTVRVWSARTHRQLGKPLDVSQVNAVAFGPDGRTLVSGGADNVVAIWDAHSRELVTSLTGHRSLVWGLAFSSDGRTLATGGSDGVRLWDVRVPAPLSIAVGGERSTRSVALSPDGRVIASGGDDGTIVLIDARTRARVGAPLLGHAGGIQRVAFSPDGGTLASSGWDETIRLWDVRTRKPLGRTLTGHGKDGVFGLAFSPNGRRLVSAGGDKTVRVWDVRTHRQSGPALRGHTEAIFGATFSPDGRTVASAGQDGTIRLWDVAGHRPLATLEGHRDAVSRVVFSPDGRTLVSSSWDTTVRLWDVRKHKQIRRPLSGHSSRVNTLAFSPDGRTLASAGLDTFIRLWDVGSHRQLGRALAGPVDELEDVTFSADGRTLASAGRDTGVRLWNRLLWRDVGELKAQVCGLVGSRMSRSEWAQYAGGVSYRQSCPDPG